MTIAFVIGNGISRRDVPLPLVQRYGKTYGCNALYRDFTPNVLVATDLPIATLIQETGYSTKNKFYTRRPIAGLGACQLPREYFGYSSGPNAVGLAARDMHQIIYMIGFDMGPTEKQGFNNMYADSEFYKKSSDRPTFSGNWVKQISKITMDYPTTKFIRVCGETTARIPELEGLKNMRHESLATFLDRINNQKDF